MCGQRSSSLVTGGRSEGGEQSGDRHTELYWKALSAVVYLPTSGGAGVFPQTAPLLKAPALSVLLLLLTNLPVEDARAQDAALDERVAAVAAQLRRSWAADPSTASRPFPSIEMLPDRRAVTSACRSSEAMDGPDRAASYCPSSGSVLLDRALLTRKLYRDRTISHSNWPITYWVGTALAESLVPPAGSLSPSPPAAVSLLTNCVAGVLIGATPGQTPPADVPIRLAPALGAYGASQADRMGTRSQRGYAFLTGFGATEASCTDADMQALAVGRVSDPDVLMAIENIPDDLRAKSSLFAAVNSNCRPRPAAPCPRRIQHISSSAVSPAGSPLRPR